MMAYYYIGSNRNAYYEYSYGLGEEEQKRQLLNANLTDDDLEEVAKITEMLNQDEKVPSVVRHQE
jgi:hypothetical protein